MYSEEPLERQWAQVREVLLAMEEQCDDLVIDCLQGMVGEQGCQEKQYSSSSSQIISLAGIP